MNANCNNTKQNMSDKKGAMKPFCKVCHDAGKSEVVYTSHWVKSKTGPDGIVVCPTLLAQECRYCHESGHTPSFCKKLVRYNREREKKDQQPKRIDVAKKPLTQVAKFGGGFAALGSDSDSDESPCNPVTALARCVSTTPAAGSYASVVAISTTPAAGSYASVVAKSKMQFELEQERLQMVVALEKSERFMPKKVKVPNVSVLCMNWADVESDSSDDEEDVECVSVEDSW